MIFKGKCACGTALEVEGKPMPPENCGGKTGFFSIDAVCPGCGAEIETVVHENK